MTTEETTFLHHDETLPEETSIHITEAAGSTLLQELSEEQPTSTKSQTELYQEELSMPSLPEQLNELHMLMMGLIE